MAATPVMSAGRNQQGRQLPRPQPERHLVGATFAAATLALHSVFVSQKLVTHTLYCDMRIAHYQCCAIVRSSGSFRLLEGTCQLTQGYAHMNSKLVQQIIFTARTGVQRPKWYQCELIVRTENDLARTASTTIEDIMIDEEGECILPYPTIF